MKWLANMSSALALVCTSNALMPVATAQTCTPNWIPTFGSVPGFSGTVGGLATLDLPGPLPPSLIVGGDFQNVGGTEARSVVAWDGQRWRNETPGLIGTPRCFVVHDDGSGPALIAGGSMLVTLPTGQVSSRVARFQNGLWEPLGGDLGTNASGDVRALVEFDFGSGRQLYAGGSFTTGPGSYLLRWDGASWLNVGFTFGTVEALRVFDDGNGPKLYAATSNNNNSRVARYDGSTWTTLGGMFNASVRALEIFDDGTGPKLVAGGFFTLNAVNAVSGIAKWNGATWSSVGAGVGPSVSCVRAFDDGGGAKLYVGGSGGSGGPGFRGLGCFDGQAWSALPGQVLFDVRQLEVFDAGDGTGPKLYAMGPNAEGGGLRGKSIIAWDGTEFSVLGDGLTGIVYATIAHDDSGSGSPALFFGGRFFEIGGAPALNVARWENGSWSTLGGGMFHASDVSVRAFASFDDGSGLGAELYAGGSFTQSSGVPTNNIARWDGNTWSPLGSGLDGLVHALAVFDDGAGPALFVGGTFDFAGGQPSPALARWNGVAWSAIPGIASFAQVRALQVFDDGSGSKLYVAGTFPNTNVVTGTRGIARWNGSTWESVGGGLSGDALALCVHDDGSGPALIVGGAFLQAGPIPALRVARWNGSQWSALGAGLSDWVHSVASVSSGSIGAPQLFAGGAFALSGTTSTGRIARWDGAGWHSLGGSLMSGGVQSIVEYDFGGGDGPALVVAGSFAASPARDSFVARWGCDGDGVLAYCTAMVSAIGCVPTLSTTGAPTVTTLAPFVLSASGVEGGRNGLFFYGASGRNAAAWGPGGIGTLCVKAPVQRMSVTGSGGSPGVCDGLLSIDWSAYVASDPTALGRPYFVGQRLNAQGWIRDPGQIGGSSLTGGLEFELQP